MHCVLLFLVAVLPLSTALHQGRVKPPAECEATEIKFPRHDEYVKKINKYRKLMIEGNQRNGQRFRNLPMGENVLEMEWSCDLEKKAIAAFDNTCPTQPPGAPTNTTGFFVYQNETDEDPMDLWLSEINRTHLDLHEHPEAPVRCHGKNPNYCNLVRYDAARIGCAEKDCSGKKSTFCLIDRP
ncbi:hypothetical protein Y032_0030g2143 [Ancylostoma ceylanicum]|nr:hypothetical protein Y032_0030g2143 [Ancylostoma ceylanicum]